MVVPSPSPEPVPSSPSSAYRSLPVIDNDRSPPLGPLRFFLCRQNRNMASASAAMTPMTIPAIAPAESELLDAGFPDSVYTLSELIDQ